MLERFAVVPYEGKQKYIFISYSHRDTKRVYPILERLSKEGYRVWYDEGIDPGSEWPESIAEHLGNAAACIAMISNNYLASDNCRREMNFALKRQIPMLSLLLEDVEMSAGVEMQLSANQAIFKHLLPSEDVFIEKINGTKILQSSREIIQKPVETAPSAPVQAPPAPSAPAAAPAPKTAPAPPTAPAAEVRKKQQEKPPKEKTTKRMGKKQWMYVLIGAAALIVILVVILAVTGSSGKTGADPALAAADPNADADIMDAPDTPLNKETLLTSSPFAGRVLWGKKTATSYADMDEFVQKSYYADIALGSGTANVSELPFAIEVRKDDHPEIIRLYYYDKIGTEYIAQGAYAIRDGKLSISPCDAVFEDAQPLAEELTYLISLHWNELKLETTAHPRYLFYRSDEATLCGAADNAAFQEIRGLELQVPQVGADCSLYFTDGGQAKDAKVSDFYDNIGSLNLKWTQESRPYNGTTTDFDADGKCMIYYLNTYPYGFLLIDSKDVYLYQQPLMENTPDSSEEAAIDPVAHTYEFVRGVNSWETAQKTAAEKGGYLVRFDSAEEFEFVTKEIEADGYLDTRFIIGARRAEDSTDYYFVDAEDRPVSEKLNDDASWASAFWMSGEPTIEWEGDPEWIVALEYESDTAKWVLNDVSDNSTYPADINCHGFIIEYEP